MLFEKQQYQENFANNIVSILDECNVFNDNYLNLKNTIKLKSVVSLKHLKQLFLAVV
ncbi:MULTISPECIES: hypothetical protein [Francisella]|uniref:hypothetical protein n=1 Tax=Francisella TaxID=262 RepID=UPI0009095D79|nr:MULTISPECIES: hypothetical protein [Francisella]APC91037.1 Type III restriction-modification system restriction subunit [Francisella sp. MA067296]